MENNVWKFGACLDVLYNVMMCGVWSLCLMFTNKNVIHDVVKCTRVGNESGEFGTYLNSSVL